MKNNDKLLVISYNKIYEVQFLIKQSDNKNKLGAMI